MYHAECLRQREELRAAPKLVGQRIGGEGDQLVEVPVDQRPDDPVAQSFGGWIDWQHLSGRERIGLPVGLRQHDVLPRHQLAAMVEADRPRDQQRLAHRDGAVEKGLTRPHALDDPAVVAEHGVKDPEAAAGGQHALRDHPSDARHFVP